MDYSIRNISSEDKLAVSDLQEAYIKVYPGAEFIPAVMYLSPIFEYGANVFCAFDGQGRIVGYTAVNPEFSEKPGVPHNVWAAIRIHPDCTDIYDFWNTLFRYAITRARKICELFPGHEIRLMFQIYSSETESSALVQSSGCSYLLSGFRMTCGLSQESVILPPPVGIEVRETRLESVEEQKTYVVERNEAFPDSPVTLESWQQFLASPLFKGGTTFTAFVDNRVVGSVAAYWDVISNRRFNRSEGFTEFIFVKETWRRRGIASYLISLGLDYLRKNGIQEARLDADAHNRDALSIYEKLGFVIADESKIFTRTL